MKTVLALLAALSLTAGVPCPKKAPTWDFYELKAILSVTDGDIREPIHAWYDGELGNSRYDYFGGITKTYQISNYTKGIGSAFSIMPVTTENYVNHHVCWQTFGNIGHLSLLPDLRNFKCKGHDIVDGEAAQKWVYGEEGGSNAHNLQIMWIQWRKIKGVLKPVPYLKEVKSTDHYVISFKKFSANKPAKSVWEIPKTVKCSAINKVADIQSMAVLNPIKALVDERDYIAEDFDKFLATHGKVYDSSEHNMRKAIFRKNHQMIHAHNRAGHSYKLALNRFADWTESEIKALRGRLPYESSNGGSPFPYSGSSFVDAAASLPKNFDWRPYGAVSPVKDQWQCGSCWSFGATGTIEGANFLKTGTLIRLSEQALIDCSWGFMNEGCNGGYDVQAYNWALKHGGLPLEDDYPYLSIDGKCHINQTQLYAKITGWINVVPKNETALKIALFKNGPISVAINAARPKFSFYSSGVYNDPDCKGESRDLDHQVLVVGYGVLKGQKYWLVKNSWGMWWGNEGYILMSTKNNMCGVMTQPTYVTM